ncbi:MAG: hypothetical protein WCI11_04530 [Candidatus Methylumidiphilus sp.]
MSSDELKTKIPTLNPLYLQAVRDEAAKREKAGQADPKAAKPLSALAMPETKVEGSAATLEQTETYEFFQQSEPIALAKPALAEKDAWELPGAVAKAKVAIAGKRAEIDQTRQQLDRLVRIKAVVEPVEPVNVKANLNELRMKRLAIQMALMADDKQYDDKDLLAVDKQIAGLTGLAAANRQSDTTPNSVESLRLNAKIDVLQDRLQVLMEELNDLLFGHNVRVAFKKAEEYLHALRAANSVRHELLALAELLANDDILGDMKLGGELPIPSGFEPFDGIFPDTLATTIEGIEEAKPRVYLDILT